MAARPAQRRPAARQLPTHRGDRDAADVHAAPAHLGRARGDARPTDAEGAGANESPTALRDQRHHRADRAEIIRAIVAGERDPAHLARFRHGRCRATPAEITAALTGHYRPELLFALQQNLELYDACERQIAGCDRVIETHVRTLTVTITPPGPLPAARAARQRIEPAFEVRAMLHHLTGGIDLTQIDGIGAYTALKLVAEIGTDMRRWPSAQHFT
jgi:Transposase IS116/IS110/IS902 family